MHEFYRGLPFVCVSVGMWVSVCVGVCWGGGVQVWVCVFVRVCVHNILLGVGIGRRGAHVAECDVRGWECK